MSIQKDVILALLGLSLLINARLSMDGVYVNGNIALAIVCYQDHSHLAESMFSITGMIFNISNPSVHPVSVLGWSDSCNPIPWNSFTLNLQNQTQDLKTTWKISWKTSHSLSIYPQTIDLHTGFAEYSLPSDYNQN